MDTKAQMQRWRLILGQESGDRLEKMDMPQLSEEQMLMDNALASIYNKRVQAKGRQIRRFRGGLAM